MGCHHWIVLTLYHLHYLTALHCTLSLSMKMVPTPLSKGGYNFPLIDNLLSSGFPGQPLSDDIDDPDPEELEMTNILYPSSSKSIAQNTSSHWNHAPLSSLTLIDPLFMSACPNFITSKSLTSPYAHHMGSHGIGSVPHLLNENASLQQQLLEKSAALDLLQYVTYIFLHCFSLTFLSDMHTQTYSKLSRKVFRARSTPYLMMMSPTMLSMQMVVPKS